MPPRCRRHDPRRAITLGHNPALLLQGPPAPRSCRDHLQPRDGRHRRMLSHTPMSQTLSPLSQGGPPRTNTLKMLMLAKLMESPNILKLLAYGRIRAKRSWTSASPCSPASLETTGSPTSYLC